MIVVLRDIRKKIIYINIFLTVNYIHNELSQTEIGSVKLQDVCRRLLPNRYYTVLFINQKPGKHRSTCYLRMYQSGS